MHAGRPPAGAVGGHRIVGIAEADREADQGPRSGAIVAAEGGPADVLLGRGAAGRGIGVEPLRAAEAARPGVPVGCRLAGRGRRPGAIGGGQLFGAPRAGAPGQQRGELSAGGERERLRDAGIVARQHRQGRHDLARGKAEQGGHGAQAGPRVEGGVDGAGDGDLVAAQSRRGRHHRLQVQGHVGRAVAQARIQEAGQARRAQVLEGSVEAAGGRQDGVAAHEARAGEQRLRRAGQGRRAGDVGEVGCCFRSARPGRCCRD